MAKRYMSAKKERPALRGVLSWMRRLSGLVLDGNARPGDDIHSLRVAQENQADNKGHHRDNDRIPKAGIDVALRRNDCSGEQGTHAAEPSVADVIRQRH